MSVHIFLSTHLPATAACIQHTLSKAPELLPLDILLPRRCSEAFSAEPARVLPYSDLPQAASFEAGRNQFIILDPLVELDDWLVATAEMLRAIDALPDRIITIVDCAAAEQSSAVREFFDACIYCSDLVLLGNRAAAGRKFISDFQKSYARRCFPCRFLLLKENGAYSPLEELLVPEPRRLCHTFDPPDDNAEPLDIEIEASFDLGLAEEEAPADASTEPYPHADQPLPDIRGQLVGF
jgi:hypothetical protein